MPAMSLTGDEGSSNPMMMVMMIVAWMMGSVLILKTNFMTSERKFSKRDGMGVRARWGGDAGDGIGGDSRREEGSTGTIGR